MGRFNTISDVWSYLDQIPMFSKVGAAAGNFALENISKFCELIGNPQNEFRSIHVAGTNGKGTTCHLLEAVYKEAGFRTGMFTSPHLLRYNERVRVNGADISDEQILNFFQYAESALNEVPLTYFEISTVLAFWTFAAEGVELAIIEAGLGGRLDSTNIITPVISVITSIGLDHQDILGDTLEKIAAEKAGIIKNGVPVVIGNIADGPRSVIESVAEDNDSLLISAVRFRPEFDAGTIRFEGSEKPFETNFIEPVNRWNAAIVKAVADLLNETLEVSQHLYRKVLLEFKGVPGRFERLHPEYSWYFSGSHNIQAVEAMMEAVNNMEVGEKILVFSMMKDKVNKEIIGHFSTFNSLYYVEQHGSRAAGVEDVRTLFPVQVLAEEEFPNFLNEFKTSLVIFAGSFYFYATIKRWLQE